MATPIIAIVGYVGKLGMPWLQDAIEEGRIKALRVLSRRCGQFRGAKGFAVNYDKRESRSSSRQCQCPAQDSRLIFPINVGTMGLQRKGWQKNKKALVDATARNKVSVYIPSRFGTYYYSTNYPNHPKSPSFSGGEENSQSGCHLVDDGTELL